MTTDPTDAAMRELETIYDEIIETEGIALRPAAKRIIDAYLRAAVACPQCEGAGWTQQCAMEPDGCQCGLKDDCPGPHTQINIEHDCGYDCEPGHLPPKVLYADPELIESSVIVGRALVVSLPPGWTVT